MQMQGNRERHTGRREVLVTSGTALLGSLAGCIGGSGGSSENDSGTSDEEMSELEEAASNESGTIALYHSAPTEAGDAILSEFESRYPFVDGTDNVRSASGDLVTRINSEIESDDLHATVAHHTQINTWIEWRDEGYLLELGVDEVENYPDELVTDYWAPARALTAPWGVNTNEVDVDSVPDTWSDIVEYMVNNHGGNLGFGAVDGGGIAMNDMWVLDREFGEEAWEWVENIHEAGASYYTSGGAQVNDVVSGAVVASQNLQAYRIEELASQGAPITSIFPEEGVTVQPIPIGVMEGTDLPNTGRLLVEFMLGEEGQQIVQEAYQGYSFRDPAPVEPEHIPAFDSFNHFSIDFDEIAGDTQRIRDRFAEITGR